MQHFHTCIDTNSVLNLRQYLKLQVIYGVYIRERESVCVFAELFYP